MKKGSLFILRFISILLLVIVSIILFAILIPIAYLWRVIENLFDEILAPNKMVDIVKKQVFITGDLLDI